MLHYFSDFFDNLYEQNSDLELLWKFILTGGLHKHAILIKVTRQKSIKATEQNTKCIHEVHAQASNLSTVSRLFII